jgi:hypothetical protein
MPVVAAAVRVPVDPATAFAVSQTTGLIRLRWDPFIRRQRFADGATAPGKDVRTITQHRLGFTMVSRYISYRPPTNVGMEMVEGPAFFATFAGGWRFRALPPAPDGGPRTEASWRYSFRCRPAWLAPLAELIGVRVLQRELDRRIAAFAHACRAPAALAPPRPAHTPPRGGGGGGGPPPPPRPLPRAPPRGPRPAAGAPPRPPGRCSSQGLRDSPRTGPVRGCGSVARRRASPGRLPGEGRRRRTLHTSRSCRTR